MLKIKVISKVQSATGITKAISDVVTFILGAINSISSITNFVVVGRATPFADKAAHVSEATPLSMKL